MLQEIRDKSQGWIAIVIVGVIVLLFAFTGFDAIFRAVGHDEEVATINGEGLSKTLYNSTYEQQQRILTANKQFDGSTEAKEQLKKFVMENLINNQILLQAANNAGLGYLPTSFVESMIQRNPAFQMNDQFNYNTFKETIYSYGYRSEQQYIQDQLERYYLLQLQSGIVRTDFATSDEVEALAKLIGQTRDFSYKELKANTIKDISEEEIKAWYEEHKNTLKTPEQVVLEYIALNKSDFLNKVSVSDQELSALYAKKINILQELGKRKRIAHILIPVTSKQPEAEAKIKIDEIAKKIASGADFATVAKNDSQDLGTANKGGDLGYLKLEDLPDQESLSPVVEQLNKVGDVSAPVRSQFGWHIIKLTAAEDPVIPSFASLKDALTSELTEQKAAELYLTAQRELDSEAYENYDSLSMVAEQLKLPLETAKPFAKGAGYDELTSNQKLDKLAFSADLIDGDSNSPIIDLSPERSVVIRVKEHLKPEMMTLEQATPQIIKILQSEKIKHKGEQLIAEIKAGDLNVKDWVAFNDVQQPIQKLLNNLPQDPAIAKEVLDKVFSTPHPEANKPSIQGFTLENGDYAIIAVTKINPFNDKLTDKQKMDYQAIIEGNDANNFWAEYEKYLKDKAEIKYFELN